MADLRPVVTNTQVVALLSQHFHEPINDLILVEGGQVARVFSFRVQEQEYIVRFNLDKMLDSNFPKEAYILRKLVGTALPVAPIVHMGRMDELQFAIAHKIPGKTLQMHTPQEVRTMLPQILDLIEAAHNVGIGETKGYGVFDDQGKGPDANWHVSLLKIIEEEDERNYFGQWHRLFNETFLERELFDDLYQRMKELLVFCPQEERTLLLGAFTLGNLLAQNGKITAVLDLLNASYGDAIYDIVPMDFWWPTLGIREAYLADQQRRGREIPFYAERLLCYECHYALDGLRFFAKSGNRQGYDVVREIIQQKLTMLPRRVR